MNGEQKYQIHIKSDITILDKAFYEEESDKKFRRKLAKPKAFNRSYGYKFFKNSKGYKANMDDVIAKLDSMLKNKGEYIINLKK